MLYYTITTDGDIIIDSDPSTGKAFNLDDLRLIIGEHDRSLDPVFVYDKIMDAKCPILISDPRFCYYDTVRSLESKDPQTIPDNKPKSTPMKHWTDGILIGDVTNITDTNCVYDDNDTLVSWGGQKITPFEDIMANLGFNTLATPVVPTAIPAATPSTCDDLLCKGNTTLRQIDNCEYTHLITACSKHFMKNVINANCIGCSTQCSIFINEISNVSGSQSVIAGLADMHSSTNNTRNNFRNDHFLRKLLKVVEEQNIFGYHYKCLFNLKLPSLATCPKCAVMYDTFYAMSYTLYLKLCIKFNESDPTVYPRFDGCPNCHRRCPECMDLPCICEEVTPKCAECSDLLNGFNCIAWTDRKYITTCNITKYKETTPGYKCSCEVCSMLCVGCMLLKHCCILCNDICSNHWGLRTIPLKLMNGKLYVADHEAVRHYLDGVWSHNNINDLPSDVVDFIYMKITTNFRKPIAREMLMQKDRHILICHQCIFIDNVMMNRYEEFLSRQALQASSEQCELASVFYSSDNILFNS